MDKVNNFSNITHLLSCLQWMLAPTDLDGRNPDPYKRPHVLSNSWGFYQPVQAFDRVIQSLQAAGIFVVFAAGNDGPKCETLRYPAQNKDVFTVGATAEKSYEIARFSSKGPAYTHYSTKPNIVSPGEHIITCDLYESRYVTMSGTR